MSYPLSGFTEGTSGEEADDEVGLKPTERVIEKTGGSRGVYVSRRFPYVMAPVVVVSEPRAPRSRSGVRRCIATVFGGPGHSSGRGVVRALILRVFVAAFGCR